MEDEMMSGRLNRIRKRLYSRLHPLAIPMGYLKDRKETASSPFPCGTDGCFLYWNTKEPSEILLLHQVIHCLFAHPFAKPAGCSPKTWSLACDIAAWHISFLWLPELFPKEALPFYLEMTDHAGEISLYHPGLLIPLLEGTLAAAGDIPWFFHSRDRLLHTFSTDDHSRWPVWGKESLIIPRPKASGSESKGEKGAAGWLELKKQLTQKGGPLAPEKPRQKKNGFSPFAERSGRKALTLTDARRYDYRSLLKSLARWGEEMDLNTDEFQYASYLYGLEHYNNLPLIEPLEYKESKKIRELAIVIDTSGSCSHSLTRAFLEETRNLIREESLFFRPFNLHIVQCDTKVERDDKITCPEDLESYIRTLEICGMGGTDFRPAFSHIEALQKSREFTELSAILYFTDGAGLYPEKAPDARTIFIFLKDRYDAIDVPSWAETLVLDAE